jgi:4'-phosphopantetheinyl transferase
MVVMKRQHRPWATRMQEQLGCYDASVQTNVSGVTNISRATNIAAVERVVEAYDRLHRLLAPLHAADLLDLDLTLAQLKTLYVASTTGPIRMSRLAVRLGTALSTTSGVVDRLVQVGLLQRLEDPSDRRQVLVQATPVAVARLDNINELGRERLRELLESIPTADDLAIIERAIELLTDAATRQSADETTEEYE